MIGEDLLNYKILEKLGAGGQGTVYKALDKNLNRVVVVKVLAPKLTKEPDCLERFKREARLASSLEHPNICTIYGLDEVNGLHFIVMQYVEGHNVRHLVNGTPLELNTALRIAIQVADALASAHARGIIHRDITAGNVMVTESGLVKILDFGLAKLVQDPSANDKAPSPERITLTEIGSPYGTASYAAPEQARGDLVDHRADIFSCGVLLYEMLAGTWPFRGRNVIEVRYAVINQQPVPIAERRGTSIPTHLENAIEKALAKNPDHRYQNMAELRDELVYILREKSKGDSETVTWLQRHTQNPPLALEKTNALVRTWRWLSKALTSKKQSSQISLPDPASQDKTEETKVGVKRSVAVLPFRNLAADSETDFYQFALADAVITELARVGAVEVRPSAAILRYLSGEPNPLEVARELKVDSVLTSGFLKQGNCLYVTTQLLSVKTQDLLWGERLEVTSDNLIDLQSKIAVHIAEGLGVKLAPDDSSDVRPSENVQGTALEEYLRGRDAMKGLIQSALSSFDEYLRGREAVGGDVYPSANLESIEIAIGHFRRAIEINPEFARAYSSLGSCYTSRVIRFAGDSKDYALAKKAFDRALTIEPGNIEARVNLAFFQMAQGLKESARADIAQMLDRAPLDVGVNFVSFYLNRLDGEYEKALDSLARVLRLSPNAKTIVCYNRARIFIFQGHYEKAWQELQQGVSFEPEHPLINTFRSICLLLQNRAHEAANSLREVLERHPDLEGIRPNLGMCLASLGDDQGARAQINDKVKEMAEVSHDIPYWLGTLYAMLGDDEDAFRWLDKTIELGNENLPWFETNPFWKNLRKDPRFVASMDKLRDRRRARESFPQLI